MRKRFLFFLLATALGITLGGCNKKDETEEPPIENAGEELPAVESTTEGMSYDVGTVIGVSEICNTDPMKEISETCFIDEMGGVTNTITVEGEGTKTAQVYVKYTDGSEWMGVFTYTVNSPTTEEPSDVVEETPTPEEPAPTVEAYKVSPYLNGLLQANAHWDEYKITTVDSYSNEVETRRVFTTNEDIIKASIGFITSVDNAVGYTAGAQDVVWSFGIIPRSLEQELSANGLSPMNNRAVIDWMKSIYSSMIESSFTSFRDKYPEDTDNVKVITHTLGDGSTFESLTILDQAGITKASQVIPDEESQKAIKDLGQKLVNVLDKSQFVTMTTDYVLHDASGVTYPVKKVCLKEDLTELIGLTNIVPVYYYVELETGDYLMFSLQRTPESKAESEAAKANSIKLTAEEATAVISTLIEGYAESADSSYVDSLDSAEVEKVKEWIKYWNISSAVDNVFIDMNEDGTLGELYVGGEYSIETYPKKVMTSVDEYKEFLTSGDGGFNTATDGFISLLYSKVYLDGTTDKYAEKLFAGSYLGTLDEMTAAVFPKVEEPEVTPEPTPDLNVSPTPTPFVEPTYQSMYPELYRWPERELVYRRFIYSLTDLGKINGTIHSQGVDPGMDYYVERYVPTPTPIIDNAGKEWYPFVDENEETHNPYLQDDGTVTYPTYGGVPTPTPVGQQQSSTPSFRPTVIPVVSVTPRPTQIARPVATSTPTPTPFIYVNKNEDEEGDKTDKKPTPKPTATPRPNPTAAPSSSDRPKSTPTPTPFIFVNKNEETQDYWTDDNPSSSGGSSSESNESLSLKISTANAVYSVSNANNRSCLIDQASSNASKVEVVYNGNRYFITVEDKSTIDMWTTKSFMNTSAFKDGQYTIGVSGSIMVASKNGSIYVINYTDSSGNQRRDGYLVIVRNGSEYIAVRSNAPIPTDDISIVAKLVSIVR